MTTRGVSDTCIHENDIHNPEGSTECTSIYENKHHSLHSFPENCSIVEATPPQSSLKISHTNPQLKGLNKHAMTLIFGV